MNSKNVLEMHKVSKMFAGLAVLDRLRGDVRGDGWHLLALNAQLAGAPRVAATSVCSHKE